MTRAPRTTRSASDAPYIAAAGSKVWVAATSSIASGTSRFSRTLSRVGLVNVRGVTQAQRLRLTPRGYDVAAEIVRGYTHSDSWSLLLLCAALGGPNECEVLGRGLSYDLPDGYILARLEELACPLLVAGLLTSHSDTNGCIGYYVTNVGLTAIQAGRPPLPDPLPAYDSQAAELYSTLFLVRLAERESWTPQNQNEICIPSSAGTWHETAESEATAALRLDVLEWLQRDPITLEHSIV